MTVPLEKTLTDETYGTGGELAAAIPAPEALATAPDGGGWAWAQVLAGHLVAFNSWGYVNSFGLFQAYYMAAFDATPSAISWVGSIQIFLTLFVGAFSGRFMDAGYYRAVVGVGLALQVVGTFTTASVGAYWQLLLAQGLCQGLGNGLVYTPTVTLVASWFARRRAVAVAGMTSGAATGGVVFPLVARQLLSRIGFAWTVRVMGFVILANAALVMALARPRPRASARRKGPLLALRSFRDPWFSLFGLGLMLALMGLYFGYYYMIPFAQDVVHVSATTSLDLLLVSNALSLPGRIILGLVADRFLGPLNMLIVTLGTAGIVTFAWVSVSSLGGIWAFAALYGLIANSAQGMFPAALAGAQRTDPARLGGEMGLIFALISLGCLCGPPIAGALLMQDGGRYLPAQMFAGTVLVAGAGLLVVPRGLSVGWRWTGKV